MRTIDYRHGNPELEIRLLDVAPPHIRPSQKFIFDEKMTNDETHVTVTVIAENIRHLLSTPEVIVDEARKTYGRHMAEQFYKCGQS